MRAIHFDVTIPGFLFSRTVGKLTDAFRFSRATGLSMGEADELPVPPPGWVRLDILGCGICGTDLGNLDYAASPILEPFGSFPAVPGHEILGRVESVGPGVRSVRPGDRVAVDPLLSCAVRGFAEDAYCPSCLAGLPATCGMAGEEGELVLGASPLRRGIMIGYHRDLPGGWSERMLAHESQLFPVHPGLPNRTAVLLEPLSIAMHAVLNGPPRGDEGDVLVIGSGPIAFAATWALRATGFGGAIVAQTKRSHEADLARALGATEAVSPGEPAREALIATGARAYQPILGDEVYSGGGFARVFDCVGSRASLSQALRFVAPRGRVVMLGCAAQMKKVDLTLLWAREVEVRGFFGYGREKWRGEEIHTFEVVQRLLLETGAPLDRLVTHVFPLEQYRYALSAAATRARSGAVKVVLTPGEGSFEEG